MSHVQGFDSMDEMQAAMAASEDAANAGLHPGQIRARDAITETLHWAQVVSDWDMIIFGETPPIAEIAERDPGFDIADLPHSAVGQPEGDPITHVLVREEKGMRPGGFGLLTVRASVDELLYNEKRNEVVFIKYLD